MKLRKWSRYLLAGIVLCLLQQAAWSQNMLNRNLSLEVNRQRLDHVLEILSNRGSFYFSYNSNIIKKDSLVTLSVSNKPVRQILNLLLPDHYEFVESGNYIIIRKTPIRITLVTNKAVAEDRFYNISGYVLDDETGHQVSNASVYEKALLVSTLTNQEGFFKLKLKQKNKKVALTVSKEFYEDTTFTVDPGFNQQITITIVPVSMGSITIISPEDYFAPEQLKVRVQKDSVITEYTYTKTDSTNVEGTRIGRLLLSAGQKFQSLNLKRFFTTRPFQVSLTPGLGTHGRLSAQVVNNFSLNVFGGYNGGVNGVEIGGLFNIDKKDVRYVQVAGLLNVNGGRVQGVQVAGINNTVLKNVTGVQVGGVNNFVAGELRGLQVGGVANITTRTVNGVQIAGVINYAKVLKGVQVGLINISDTSEGLSFGLINIVLKGYHKLSFSADEIVRVNAAFKTGSRKLYSILQAGYNFNDSSEVFTFGYGLGSELRLNKTLSLNPEITAQHLYLGSWDYANILSRGRLNLNIHLGKYISLFAGPVYNVYYSNQDVNFPGYKNAVSPSGYSTHNFSTNVKGWLGWNAGINFF